MLFRQIFDSDLAQYSYLVGCQKTGEALVIDPERDIWRYVELAEGEGLRLVAVAETHIHADFLSGARQFASDCGGTVYLSDEGTDDWKYEWARSEHNGTVKLLKDGDTFQVGKIEIRAVHTPGHTPEHLSYIVTDRGGGAESPLGIASGDFVFVGDLGRPDLLESAAGAEGAMKPAAQQLFRSLPSFLTLDDSLQVWPGHGAGSSCGKALGAVPMSTVGYERRYNDAIRHSRGGEEEFVDFILDAQPEPPLYFARMKQQNKQGPKVLDGLPEPAAMSANEAIEWAEERGDSSWAIVDTRTDRDAFLARHLPGSLFAPIGKGLGEVAGSYVEEETPIVLVVGRDELDRAVRTLIRIGLDQIVGWVDAGAMTEADGRRVRSIESTDFAALPKQLEESGGHVLDVRGIAEYRDGHLPGAQQIAHTRLAAQLDEVPREQTLYVHCASGQRAAYASSELVREGFTVVHIDDMFENAEGTVSD